MSEWVGHKGSAPELESAVGRSFESDTVYGRDIDSVGDGVSALNGLPGFVLAGAVLLFFRRMPADRRGIEQNLRATQRCETRGFGIPLVPADECRDASEDGVEAALAEVAGSEIEFFEVEGIIGDVHLSVQAQNFAGRSNHRRCVVVDARGAALEQRCDDDDVLLFRNE